MSDVRPFEEYKEMIKDMRKEEMIRGLYDLSARVTKQDKEIERLNNIIDKAKEKSIYLQERYGYILDDLTFMLMQGSDK